MAILTIFFTLLFAFILWRSIVGAGRTAARATEAHARLTQEQTQMFFDAMTPDAQARITDARQQRIATARADQKQRLAVVGVALLVFALIWFVAMLVPSPARADFLPSSYPELGLTNCRQVTIIRQTCLKDGKPWTVIWQGSGLDALDDGKELAVMRIGPGEPRALRYFHTPRGQLPACDAAEMIYWLAGTRRPLGAVVPPETIGTIKGKNLCSASVMGGGYVTYTIELMDDGRWWVHR